MDGKRLRRMLGRRERFERARGRAVACAGRWDDEASVDGG